MKDSEIIKALEFCSSKNGSCRGCPFYCKDANCINDVKKQAIAIINRQQAEIERLEKHELSEAMKFNKSTINQIKSEAIKEFVERLKEKKKNSTMDSRICTVEMIDKLAKEMVGENNA